MRVLRATGHSAGEIRGSGGVPVMDNEATYDWQEQFGWSPEGGPLVGRGTPEYFAFYARKRLNEERAARGLSPVRTRYRGKRSRV